MDNIRLIALDLDGTLLDSQKQLSRKNAAALEQAAAMGIAIVPTTGRFFKGMPEVIQALPYLRYAITMNGAEIYDVKRQIALSREEIPVAQAVALMDYLDDYPVIYDCYMDSRGWMTASMQEQAEQFTDNPHYQKMLRTLRTPVPGLKTFLLERNRSVQKVQFFVKDLQLREWLMQELPQRFPALSVSSSLENNVEINSANATKGYALQTLATELGLSLSQTMAIGDGLNDLSMICTAGIGVAMGNACPAVKAAAKAHTTSCDEDGVAAAIAQYCLNAT